MKRALIAAMAVAGLCVVAAAAFAFVAIWTHGEAASRWGGSAAMALFVGTVIGGAASMAWTSVDE